MILIIYLSLKTSKLLGTSEVPYQDETKSNDDRQEKKKFFYRNSEKKKKNMAPRKVRLTN